MKTERTEAFTLIELLVVIAIIGLLAGLLFTGVLGLVKQGRNAANKDNAALLSAAIMEYWHDQGRWPIPPGHKPRKVNQRTIYQYGKDGDESTREENGTKVYSYGLVYGSVNKNGEVRNDQTKGYAGGNDQIVQILLSATVKNKSGENVTKSYLDLEPFVTCPYEDGTDAGNVTYPIEETVPAGPLQKEPMLSKIKNGTLAVPLLYRSEFIKCPHCKKLYPKSNSRRTCENRECPYYEQNDHKFYRFKASELKGNAQGAKPFVITFDFINNKCDVTMP